ncbi:TolC family outer membrane protein [Rubellimicrobium rubrum]|uniref:TolC family outer membrane protein n=1 Tax=Rubellimicrobium rubrum TaxID=2585369 RepID=A0A5C4N1W4_9RHOB|nr:TolC family outer membrane protein [Rubellimicrobium rubrum]TNC51824.1 TolC family outer membrane protein [Rubellimicrobium rubrum]
MRNIIRGALATLVLWTGSVQAETLADALATGYEASGLVDQYRALLRAADEDVAQAVASLRPIVNWTADLSRSLSYAEQTTPFGSSGVNTLNLGRSASLGLSASLTLYDAGGRRLTVEAQKETVLATRESLRNVEQQVLLSIVSAYQEVRRSSAFVSLRENNVRVITQELRAAQDRFEVGEVTRTDVALAEAQLASARSQLVAEQGNLAQAIADYQAAVGQVPRDLAPATPAAIPQSLDEAQAIAQRTHPALLQAQHEVAAAEIGIAQAEAATRPNLSLSAQAEVNQDFEETLGVGLSASGPIYRGGALASQVRQFQARRDAARGDLLETARDIVQAVGNSYASLEVSRSSRGAFVEQVRAAQIAFEGVREEATLGARTTLDVLDAEQDLLDARANVVSAEIDETLASYQLLSAMGLLNVQNLGLNVQTYDPTAYYNLVDDAPSSASEQGRALDRVLEAIGAGN